MGSSARWIAYFVYLPQGGLTPAHRFTLARLREATDAKLLVICATPRPRDIPDELQAMCDALYWKDLEGFDFSAYALAIDETARTSSGADLLIINDSVFGPFVPIDSLWPSMAWDLTGFTASQQVQNHIQSYAFFLRNVGDKTLVALSEVFPASRAMRDYRAVVLKQETRLSSVAARAMSVGSLWYGERDRCIDPSLLAAVSLMDTGFPFFKRALLSKHKGLHNIEIIEDILCKNNHPGCHNI